MQLFLEKVFKGENSVISSPDYVDIHFLEIWDQLQF